MPPETLKDVLNMGLEVPTMYMVPKKRFDRLHGINYCEVEFPTVWLVLFSCDRPSDSFLCRLPKWPSPELLTPSVKFAYISRYPFPIFRRFSYDIVPGTKPHTYLALPVATVHEETAQ